MNKGLGIANRFWLAPLLLSVILPLSIGCSGDEPEPAVPQAPAITVEPASATASCSASPTMESTNTRSPTSKLTPTADPTPWRLNQPRPLYRRQPRLRLNYGGAYTHTNANCCANTHGHTGPYANGDSQAGAGADRDARTSGNS